MRSMIWSRLPGLYFRTLLAAFVHENRDWFNMKFVFGSDDASGFLPYGEIAAFRCAVLVPNDLTMASFVEAFAMGLPIFLPHNEWLYRLQKSVPYGFMVHAGQLPLPCEAWQRSVGPAQVAGEGVAREQPTFPSGYHTASQSRASGVFKWGFSGLQ